MIDLNKPGDPGNLYGKDVFSTFSSILAKEVNVFLRHSVTESDDGKWKFEL
jgi:hypothetical protein